MGAAVATHPVTKVAAATTDQAMVVKTSVPEVLQDRDVVLPAAVAVDALEQVAATAAAVAEQPLKDALALIHKLRPL